MLVRGVTCFERCMVVCCFCETDSAHLIAFCERPTGRGSLWLAEPCCGVESYDGEVHMRRDRGSAVWLASKECWCLYGTRLCVCVSLCGWRWGAADARTLELLREHRKKCTGTICPRWHLLQEENSTKCRDRRFVIVVWVTSIGCMFACAKSDYRAHWWDTNGWTNRRSTLKSSSVSRGRRKWFDQKKNRWSKLTQKWLRGMHEVTGANAKRTRRHERFEYVCWTWFLLIAIRSRRRMVSVSWCWAFPWRHHQERTDRS